jgi:branched-chain amino acid transport system permease protein
MNSQISLLLLQDGLISGSIYALLAVAIVLVFSVTRIIFVPQGEFVAFSALTMAALQAGKVPGTLWLVLVIALIGLVLELVQAAKARDWTQCIRSSVTYGVLPILLVLLSYWASLQQLSMPFQVLVTFALVVPLGPLLYRVAYQPVADASILVLLIISVAVHLALTGLGLVFFGPEGSRTSPFSDVTWEAGGIRVSAQSLGVIFVSLLTILILFWFFRYTFRGKALKATAVNRVGAQLMGISSTGSGRLAFAISSAIGALCGLLIAPFTTIFYDTGFLIGLKGFVAAIIGGLGSYPLAALGALLVGQLESFSSFWASAFKEVIVFTLILPVLLWRSLKSQHVEEDEE